MQKNILLIPISRGEYWLLHILFFLVIYLHIHISKMASHFTAVLQNFNGEVIWLVGYNI